MWDESAFWAEVLANPPNPNEPLPLYNQKATIYGTTIVFLIISWMAIFLRLWVRIKVVREPGWDDLFIVLAALCNVAGAVTVCLSVKNGLGHHMLYVLEVIEEYLLLLYLEKSFYITMTTFIKISLLLQYLRIFKAGIMRRICIGLLILTILWGIAFFIVGWFPCFPVRAAWIRTIDATCYGFGYNDPQSFSATYVVHSASNMAFDLAIFMIPLVLFTTPNLKLKNLLAMGGIFMCGAVVVALAIARLYTITEHRAGTYPYIDFTWWAPITIILSVLEIDLAIICASIPIFWPLIENSLAAIFVSYEVEISEERIDHYELDDRKREGSIKSSSGLSIQELIRDEELGGGELGRQYGEGIGSIGYQGNTSGIKTAVKSKSKPKWEL